MSQASLAQYGKHFQECVVQALLSDSMWAEQMLEVFNVDYFDLNYLRFLAERYFDYAKKYKVFPTMQMLITMIRDELKSGTDLVIRDQIIDYLQRVRLNPNVNDLPYVKEKTLDFARKQALKAALENAVDDMQAENYGSIVERIKKAVSVGEAPVLGHDFFEDYEARFVSMKRSCVPTGIDELDVKEILNGGLGKGEIGCVVGSTGAGKSHMLTMLGANAMRAGINVLHYTFELSETQVAIRYDSNLCDIESNLVVDNKEKIIETYKDSKLGRLRIKEYPTNTATVYTLRNHIERLSLKGWDPGLVIIDYADIMRSTRQYDSLRHELKLVYEELRGLASEKQFPIWTASQSNREGADSEVIDLTNMSEAYGKAMICDCVLTISRKSIEKANGSGRIFVAKNRAGRDGLLYNVRIDTAKSNFTIESACNLIEAQQTDSEEIKATIKKRWEELKNTLPQKQTNSQNIVQISEPLAS